MERAATVYASGPSLMICKGLPVSFYTDPLSRSRERGELEQIPVLFAGVTEIVSKRKKFVALFDRIRLAGMKIAADMWNRERNVILGIAKGWLTFFAADF